MSADGDWKITMNTPMGPQVLTLTVKTDGDKFTGALNGPMGENQIQGTISGNTLQWSADITKPMPLTLEFTATVEGDNLTGNAKLGAFGDAPLTGVRA